MESIFNTPPFSEKKIYEIQILAPILNWSRVGARMGTLFKEPYEIYVAFGARP